MAGKKRTRRSERPSRKQVEVTLEDGEIVVTPNVGTAGDDDRDRTPSDVTDRYWLHAERQDGTYPEPTQRSGKWLIYVAPRNVDEVWAKIRDAVEAGQLGGRAKVATALRERLGNRSGARVICVYTYDWNDEGDVRRVREALRQLGIDKPIPYKADADTLAGRYKATGAKGLSKYFE